MKLFIIGGNSPTAKDLIEVLRKRRIRFQAPPAKYFDPSDPVGIANLVTAAEPTQLINLADFISTNHSALRRAETTEDRCYQINSHLPAVLSEVCDHLNIPILHLSNAYVFDGMKKLGYNENDDTNPQGVYGLASLQGERVVRQHNNHIVIRSGWLFGKKKKGLIKSWIRVAKKNRGQVPVTSRRLSPTYTGHLAQAILAVIQQVDCDANVWGTYHYSGLETKREIEFVEQVIKYAANDDEPIYQLLDSINIVEQDVHAPEIFNSTLSSKKIFDTFGIKQKSWHGDLQEVIKTLYEGVYRSEGTTPENESTESDAA